MERDNFMIPFIHRRSNEVVHPGVDHEKVLTRSPFKILHPGEQNTGIAYHKTAVLEKYFEPQRFQKRGQSGSITFRRYGSLGLVTPLPPLCPAAGEGILIDDTHATTDREIPDVMTAFQFRHKRQHFLHGFHKGPGRGQL